MKRYISAIATAAASLLLVSCFGIDEGNYKELAPITFNEVSSVVQNNEQNNQEYDVILKPDILDDIPSDKNTDIPDETIGTEIADDTQDINSKKEVICFIFDSRAGYI